MHLHRWQPVRSAEQAAAVQPPPAQQPTAAAPPPPPAGRLAVAASVQPERQLDGCRSGGQDRRPVSYRYSSYLKVKFNSKILYFALTRRYIYIIIRFFVGSFTEVICSYASATKKSIYLKSWLKKYANISIPKPSIIYCILYE